MRAHATDRKSVLDIPQIPLASERRRALKAMVATQPVLVFLSGESPRLACTWHGGPAQLTSMHALPTCVQNLCALWLAMMLAVISQFRFVIWEV